MKSSKRCILQNHFENSTDVKSNKSEFSISSHFNSIQYLFFVYHQIERTFLEFYSKNNTIFVKYLFSLDIYNSSSNKVGAHTFNTTSIKLNWILRTALNRSVLSIVRSAHLFAKKNYVRTHSASKNNDTFYKSTNFWRPPTPYDVS